MNYTILEATNQDHLIGMVKSLIGKGWEPQGGIAVLGVAGKPNGVTYFQVMVKKNLTESEMKTMRLNHP